MAYTGPGCTTRAGTVTFDGLVSIAAADPVTTPDAQDAVVPTKPADGVPAGGAD